MDHASLKAQNLYSIYNELLAGTIADLRNKIACCRFPTQHESHIRKGKRQMRAVFQIRFLRQHRLSSMMKRSMNWCQLKYDARPI
ncbi:hypothetical protein EYZ11_012016 [Aspergillus tanneri]|uniref:Uncharacterized protein n=1 Tax=Aspergillus tanneri TaxID=1220188 RepID=A0A4S3J3F9_9EURO|nr:hypothetical protein EYZ11_012016 [Aspergillus tanneri]